MKMTKDSANIQDNKNIQNRDRKKLSLVKEVKEGMIAISYKK
jgi:hypothetical protein